jgi:hypothetical protein
MMYPAHSPAGASPRMTPEMIGAALSGVLSYAARGCRLTVPNLDTDDVQLCKDLDEERGRYPMRTLCRLIGIVQRSPSAKVREALSTGLAAIIERQPAFVDEQQLSLLELTAVIAKESGEATAAVAHHAAEQTPASRRAAKRELDEARAVIERGFMQLC